MNTPAHWAYLPFLLAWALPVLALQWLLGGRYLWRERALWPLIVLGLTVFFTIADAVAITAGVWRFDRHALVGVSLGPVPIEETIFYLLTAAMVVQGFVTIWFGWADRQRISAMVAARIRVARQTLGGGRAARTRHARNGGPQATQPR